MELKNFKLMHEDDTHFHVQHPSGKKMMVEKAGLSEKAHQMIKKMCAGGMAKGGSVKKYAEGTPDDTVQSDASNVPAALAPNGTPGNEDPANYDTGIPQTTSTPNAAAESSTPTQNDSQATSANTVPQVQELPTTTIVGPSKMELAFKKEQLGNEAYANAISGQGKNESQTIQNVQDEMDALPSQTDIVNQNKAASDKLLQSYMDKKIDPNHFWKDKSTGSKILAVMGATLGAMGQAYVGGNNPAMDMIDKAMNRDMDAQKSEQNKAHNLWTMNREALGTDLAADAATKSQMYTGLKYKLAQAASTFKGPMAQANAKILNAQIDQKLAQLAYQKSFMQPTKEGIADPNYPEKAVANSGLFRTPEEQKQALEEISYRKNLKSIAGPSLKAFDSIGFNRKADLNPFQDTPEQQQFEGLANTTIKEIEGTARQAAMDSLKANFMPHIGDSDERRAIKREGWIDYLNSHSAAPFTSSRGIDLNNYSSTHWVPPAAPESSTLMIAPNGKPKMVPNNQVDAAIKAGGRRK